uniref:MSP domain-containing protein n=1 Tax=Ciona savignyi TaxID=51511 RepID=H2YK02_CIOSA
MSPMSEVIFNNSSKDANTSRYRADLTLTNRHDVEGMAVAFKVKTNSPERYHVKPSTGSIGRGEVLIIRIHLSPGYEELVSRDRFLILYQKMQAGSDVAQFWKDHSDKSDRFEHRIRVRFNAAEKKHESPIILTNSVEAPKVLKTPSKPTIPSEELAGLHRELGRVKGQLTRVEEQVDWIRSYFVYSLLLQSFLLILLFFVIHKLTSITYILESTESDPNGRFSEVVNSADRTSL